MPRYLSLCIRAAPAPEAGKPALTPARLADWCRRFTPLAAADAPDGAILDIAGAAHLFGGENALAGELERRLAAWAYQARAAIADTPEAAWALARYANVRAAPAGGDEPALRRLFGAMPVAALRIAPQTAYALSQTGLKRIDDLLLRPRAPIAARFGVHVFARLDNLMGRAKSPISPRFEAPPYLVERRFAEPLSQRASIEGVIAALGDNMAQLLERHGEGARRLQASLFRVDGIVRCIEVATSRPLRDASVFARLFRERITALGAQNEDPLVSDYGFDLVQLAVMRAEPLGLKQGESLPSPLAGRQEAPADLTDLTGLADPANLADLTDLADLIDRLGARMGLRRVMRFQTNDTHIPEFAVTCVAASHSPSLSHRERICVSRPSSPDGGAGPQPPTRPLRLFVRPEPVEALAEVPDGPPRRFRWRKIMHDVAAIEGPERIAPEWWKPQASALTRDYFRVEDVNGQRFWPAVLNGPSAAIFLVSAESGF